MALNSVNVLVHGLFFMWLNQTSGHLELIAPTVDPDTTPKPCRHHLVGGIRGHLKEYTGIIDWTNIGLIGSDPPKLNPGEMPKKLKRSVLQFSMKDAGIAWNSQASFVGRFILPWPARFHSIRHDYWERSFVYYTSQTPGHTSRVGDAIKQRCYRDRNCEIGLVTCLEYTYEEDTGVHIASWRPDTNLHCYFEPCRKHSIEGVNADLRNAGKCFLPHGGFDLQLNEKALEDIITPLGHNPSTPPGYDRDDEYSLTDDPQRPEHICAAASKCVGVLNVSPANCPHIFVAP